MEIVTTVAALRERVRAARAVGATIGLVPTMGDLHDGHLSLIRRAKANGDYAVVTVFVNPMQFGPNEDFARYHRDLETDHRLATEAGGDLLFAPPAEEIFPAGFCTSVEVAGVTEPLCGRIRPGHFRGVTTVVTKIFNMTQADRAYFGEKDFQQLTIIRRLVRDLDFPLEIVPCPTIREPDGLAMSSRNRYLSPDDRQAALALSRALKAARERLDGGERNGAALVGAAEQVLKAEPGIRIDYVELLDADELTPVVEVTGPAVLAIAAHVGAARLIDNVVLKPGG